MGESAVRGGWTWKSRPRSVACGETARKPGRGGRLVFRLRFLFVAGGEWFPVVVTGRLHESGDQCLASTWSVSMPGYNHYPSCTCGWCSGGGGGSVGTFRARDGSTCRHRVRDQPGRLTVCNPTTCPICKSQVFFVRHNGGSVLVRRPGPPWPKHACFEDEYAGSQLRHALLAGSQLNAAPLFGVIIETVVIEPGESGRIVMKCSDGSIVDDVYETTLNLTHHVGAARGGRERSSEGVCSLRWISRSSAFQWRPPLRLAQGARVTLEGREFIWDGHQLVRIVRFHDRPDWLTAAAQRIRC